MKDTYLWSKKRVFQRMQISGISTIFFAVVLFPCFLNAFLLDASLLAYPEASDRYEGSVCRGIPHGRGVCAFQSGRRYEWDWVRGKASGKGVLTWKNGTKYVGSFGVGMLLYYWPMNLSVGSD
jgi:hypothetical protein